MKKLLFLVLFDILNIYSGFCNDIDTTLAKTIATDFYISKASQGNLSGFRSLSIQDIKIELVHQEFDDSVTNVPGNIEPYYYVYHVQGNNDFIIVSADDETPPILGYSFEGNFDSNNQPPAFIEWMNCYKRQIRAIKANRSKCYNTTKSASPLKSAIQLKSGETLSQVAPLLSTTWNQGCLYNNYCPPDENGDCGHVWAGCVAVAMAQIMKYWNYPNTCNEIPSYEDKVNYINDSIILNSDYGWIPGVSSTVYNWTNMPNRLANYTSTTEKEAVAELLYNCGVAVKMNYST